MNSPARIRVTGVTLLLIAGGTLCPSCSQRSSEQSSDPQSTTGELMEDQITYQFAVYYLPTPTTEPLAELNALLAQQQQPLMFRRVDEINGQEASPTVAAHLEADPQTAYTPPDLEYLQRFGRGLTPAEAEALQTTQAVLILDWSYPKEHVWTGFRSALEITDALARSTGGLVWDETTREVFTTDQWREQRIDSWTGDVPDVSDSTAIHAYQKEGLTRAITLGMQKFGLPDVVIDGFALSLSRNMGHVINLFSQSMAEGATAPVPGEFDLDFSAIRNAEVREPQVQNLGPEATGIALLSLKQGNWEEGDPDNRLIEITFDRGTGPDIPAKQAHILAEAFGVTDSLTTVEHDEAVLAASQRARERLPTLRTDFNRGLAPGEFLMVKAPFTTPDDGQEWMWVEVTAWEGDSIEGLLANEPFNIPDLQAGQQVEVSEADVFDYIRKLPDGTTEGNETAKLFEQQGEDE